MFLGIHSAWHVIETQWIFVELKENVFEIPDNLFIN